MRRLRTYLRVYLTILEDSIMMIATYRVDFFVWAIVNILELVISIVFFQAIYLRTPLIGDWNIYQVLVLLGYVNLLMGLGGLTFFPMMYEFSEMVRTGDLDRKITKPIDTQFLASFPWIDVWDFVYIPMGLLVMVYGLNKLGGVPLLGGLLAFLILVFTSLLIMYSFLLLALSLVFKSTKLEAVDHLFWTIIQLGKYPITVFKGISYFILMFIVPIGLITTVPVRFLIGIINPKDFFISIVFTVFFFALSRKIFLLNLKNYTSASS